MRQKAITTFNATSTFTYLARMLGGSHSEILGLYNDDIAQIPFDSKNFKRKLTSPEITNRLQDNIQTFSNFLKTTPEETFIFIAIYAYQLLHNCPADTRDITRFFGITELDFLPMKQRIQGLLKKGQIRMAERHKHYNEYLISKSAETAMLNNKPFKAGKAKKIDRYQFCENISVLIDMRSDDEIETRDLFKMVEEMEENSGELKFIKTVTKLLPSVEDRTLFYDVCDGYVFGGDKRHTSGLGGTLSDIYDSCRCRLNTAKAIMDKSHTLMTNGLVELLPSAFFGDAVIVLTEKSKQLFLEKDYELFRIKGKSDKRLTAPDKIPERKLFFNTDLLEDLGFVRESLADDNFKKLQSRLAENSLPKGVTLLFHGLPGTGKTAAAEMLAKETGRSIFHVDIASSKSCWFGESEKLFKQIFTDYRQMCEHEEKTPILLFNEADALFTHRRTIDSHSRDAAQTENALQNILLEEMETLDGILIATTNLSTNFDPAFDRRFLFKINFGQPDTAAKKAIWQSKLNWLSDEDAQKLAERHDLSGGQIDNIVRKALLEDVLHGQRPTLDTLESWCKSERMDMNKGGKIGFTKN